jgi:hypothetical protein
MYQNIWFHEPQDHIVQFRCFEDLNVTAPSYSKEYVPTTQTPLNTVLSTHNNSPLEEQM